MTPHEPRGPQSVAPSEPGWWQASDGLWYPPESVPAGVGAPSFAGEPVGGPPAMDTWSPSPQRSEPNAPADAPTRNGWALAAFVVGFAGFLLGAIGGIVAVVLGLVALRRPGRTALAIVGLALGVLNIAISATALGVFVAGGFDAGSATDNPYVVVPKQADYHIVITNCSSDRGVPFADATIENRSSKPQHFLVTMEFIDKKTKATVDVTDTDGVSESVRPGDTTDLIFDAVGQKAIKMGDDVTCRIADVRTIPKGL